MHGVGEKRLQACGGKARRKRPLVRPWRRWEDGIKMDLRDMHWKGYVRKRPWHNVTCYPSICLEGLSKTTKTSGQPVFRPSFEPLEYDVGALILPTRLRYHVRKWSVLCPITAKGRDFRPWPVWRHIGPGFSGRKINGRNEDILLKCHDKLLKCH
jgi:hypothetical protein